MAHHLNNKKLRVGVIGGGLNSTIGLAHFSAIQLDNNFEITSGFFSRKKSINTETQKKLKLKKIINYSSYQEYLKKEYSNLDVILILTNTESHYKIIIDIIKYNIPIICEKPSVTNYNQLKKLINKINKSKIKFFPIYNYTAYPIIRDIKFFLRHKKIGKLIQIDLSMPQQGLTFKKIDKVKKWRLKDSEVPTIQLDLGVHLISILKFLIPNIKIKKAISNETRINNKNLVHSVNSWLITKDKILCKLSVSKYILGQRNGLSLTINGTKGSFAWKQVDPEKLIFFDNNGKNIIFDRNDKELKISNQKRYNRYVVGHPYGFIESIGNYYFDIYNSLISKSKRTEYILNLNDEKFIFQILNLLKLSSLRKKWITNK